MLWVYFSLYKLSSNKAIVVAAVAGVIFLYFLDFRLIRLSSPYLPSHLFFLACSCHSLIGEFYKLKHFLSKFEMIFDFVSFRKLYSYPYVGLNFIFIWNLNFLKTLTFSHHDWIKSSIVIVRLTPEVISAGRPM